MHPTKIIALFLAACVTAAPLAPLERDLASVSEPNKNVAMITREDKRDAISDITSKLNNIQLSVNGLGSEVSAILADVLGLVDPTGLLNNLKASLTADVQLLDAIQADVAAGADLSEVSGLVDSVISTVSGLASSLNGISADVAVSGLVSEVEGLVSQILTTLQSLV